MRLKSIICLNVICAMAAVFTGCDDDDDNSPKPQQPGNGTVGTAPASLRSRSYDLFEGAGTTKIAFGASGETYTLLRTGAAQETGVYNPSKSGTDTWDLTLNKTGSTNGAGRLILTFTGGGGGDFAFTPAGGELSTGQFQSTGSDGSTTTGSTTSGTTTTGTTTTGGGGTPVAAPATLSQIVLTGKASNPAGGGQTVINFTGSTFAYSAGGFSGTYTYTPSGTSANLRLTYGGTASGDVDDYTLQFRAPSGSPTPSTYSGTQKVGAAAPGAASGTFTYNQ